ncbi:Ferrochelatase [Corynebacterium ciconiae DSM 44920]|uniref:ferrochelatase n=1 Tax=Corynebacterium ciconiae TaxID=227319 RepID=UPI00035CE2F6|nr:ferrochelatase [Corynebacterium ciconiae]WKD61220.1 Ferrochelatase [Corynebacterium ciconiae DSM 44920]
MISSSSADHTPVDAVAEADALLVLSFGGPEGPDDVLPFLRNVTRGRGIPDERLVEVGEHYAHFDGVSPLNEQNREIIQDLEQRLAAHGWDLPVYFGNRNWHPFAEDTAERMAADGVRSAFVFATSAWAGYSGCKQYHEDIARVRRHLAEKGLPQIEFTKLRHFFDHPTFIQAAVDEVEPLVRYHPHARLVFTAHSIPTAADAASGRPEDGSLYSQQIAEAARLVADRIGVSDWDVVWQSRSGAPHIPWLEPDIVDHMEALADQGERELIVFPIGFVSDHIEVIWDLDTELAAAAAERGVSVYRAASVGHNARFVQMIMELILEARGHEKPQRLGEQPSYGCGVNGTPCSPECCPSSRPGRPATHSAEAKG